MPSEEADGPEAVPHAIAGGEGAQSVPPLLSARPWPARPPQSVRRTDCARGAGARGAGARGAGVRDTGVRDAGVRDTGVRGADR